MIKIFKEEHSLQFDKEKIVNKIEEYLYNNDNIVSAYIFGSFGTEDFTNKSDIDIVILNGKEITYSSVLKLIQN